MATAQPQNTFRFFGDVWLPEPTNYLDEDQYAVFRRYMPMIRALESTDRQPTNWDMAPRYAEFVRQETEVWSSLGVNRDRPTEFLIRPSGSLNARLALHLLNPTFYVADPSNPATDDPTNPTIQLLHANGFSSNNSFIFDQFFRRVRTEDCVYFWTEDLEKPHDDFVVDLREHMDAIVEVVWGELAWTKLHGTTTCRLVKFPLWGPYRVIRLYLEIEIGKDGQRLRRFIFPVRHPQYFVRHGNPTTTSIEGPTQDLSLSFAARLVGLSICQNFYASHPKGAYVRPDAGQVKWRKYWEEQSLRELEVAFPTKFRQWEDRKLSRPDPHASTRRDRGLDIRAIQELLDETASLRGAVPTQGKGITATELEFTNLWVDRQRQLESLLHSWYGLLPSFRKALNVEDLPVADSDFFLLPPKVVKWLQAQDGLKIDGKAMESREDLETAFLCLGGRRSELASEMPIEDLAFRVGTAYINNAAFYRRKLDFLALCQPLLRTIPRKCVSCKSRVLDDAFPYLARKDTTRYVQCPRSKCASPDCKTPAFFEPMSDWQLSIRPLREKLENPPKPHGRGDWSAFFCREFSELGELPQSVQVKCRGCGGPMRIGRPRWTIEKEPRFVIPKQKCCHCEQPHQSFNPVENFECISTGALTKTWQKLEDGNLDAKNPSALRSEVLNRANLADFRNVLTAMQKRGRA